MIPLECIQSLYQNHDLHQLQNGADEAHARAQVGEGERVEERIPALLYPGSAFSRPILTLLLCRESHLTNVGSSNLPLPCMH
jgi:hypothetical protein